MSNRDAGGYWIERFYGMGQQPISLKEFDRLMLMVAYARKEGKVKSSRCLEDTAIVHAHLHQDRTVPEGMPNWAVKSLTMEYQLTPREALAEAERLMFCKKLGKEVTG